MQDSLEDYIKLYRNTKEESKKSINARQEALATAQKKKETEARAVKIVEFLIEGKLRPQVFLRCLKHINQAYYQDVVEERAITDLCGYSLCGNKIPAMPTQRYFISTKLNKVYDVTDRKNYCSNYCYKASLHIKGQVDDSPLWLRKGNEDKSFDLYPATERGLPGEEIEQGLIKPGEESAFTSVSSFTEISLGEIGELEVKKSKKTKKVSVSNAMATLHEAEEKVDSSEENETTNDLEKVEGSLVMEPKVEETLPSPEKVKKTKPEKLKKVDSNEVLQSLKKYINEWVTLETCVFLYGEEAVKQFFDEDKLTRYLENLKASEATVEQKRRYLEICKKLQLNELAEQKLDRSIIGGSFKPLPDYKQLTKESKMMDLKVHSFYSGAPYEPNVEQKRKDDPQANDNGTVENSDVNILPLTGMHSQVAQRRKIFLNSVSKSMANLLPNLGFDVHSIAEELNALVKTFNLQPHNVVFAPAVRTIISIILLKMLCQHDNSLKEKLSSKRADTFVKALLGHLSEEKELLDEIFASIENTELLRSITLDKLEK